MIVVVDKPCMNVVVYSTIVYFTSLLIIRSMMTSSDDVRIQLILIVDHKNNYFTL